MASLKSPAVLDSTSKDTLQKSINENHNDQQQQQQQKPQQQEQHHHHKQQQQHQQQPGAKSADAPSPSSPASSPSPPPSRSTSSQPVRPAPPDGGWGWVVVLSSFVVSLCVDGVCFSVGIFFDPLRHHFGSTKATTAWVGSVLNGSYLIVGPVVSAFVNRYGCRKMAVFGSSFAALCMFLSTFSPNLATLIVTFGLLGGMGFGFVYLPAIVMVGYYFERRRALATGIACCGSGIGAFIFAPLCNFLLEEYGWKGATWILSGLVLNAVIFSLFYRPLDPKHQAGGQERHRHDTTTIRNPRNNSGIVERGEETGADPSRGLLLSSLSERDQEEEEEGGEERQMADTVTRRVPDPRMKRDDLDSSSEFHAAQDLVGKTSDADDISAGGGSELESPLPQGASGELVLKEGALNSPPVTLAIPDIIVETPDSLRDREARARLSDLIQTVTPQIPTPQAKTFLSDINLCQVTSPHHSVARLALSQGALSPSSSSSSSSHARKRQHPPSSHPHHHHHHHRHRNRLEADNPLQRRDIFYSGSLRHIPEYQSSETLAEYRRKVTKSDECARREETARPRSEDEEEEDEEEEEEEEGDEKEEEEKTLGGRKRSWVKVVCGPVAQMFDFSLLRSPTFLIYGLSCTLCMAGFFVPFMYMPTLCTELGMTRTQGAVLIAIIGMASTGGRVAVGFISDQSWADCLLINNLALLVGGGATMCVPLFRQFALFAVYSAVFGTAIAVFVSLRSIIMVDLMGLEKLTTAFGLVVMCQGISSFVGTPFAGWLSDITGNYNSSFYVAGVFVALAGAICLPLRRIARWERERERRLVAHNL